MPIDFANHLLKLTLSLQTAWTGFDLNLYELFIKIFTDAILYDATPIRKLSGINT